eukprot:gb/GECH01010114.1/.p1 GENE.gb/GECH01010114.1/~~gb/GECH01010114.1/.p1  ORF type:complete len:748 (+),score=175.52 gb/GECH01010114.1/:1-2244(+)
MRANEDLQLVSEHPLDNNKRQEADDSSEDEEFHLIDGVQVPSWILDMREGWKREIEVMPVEKQEYFKQFNEQGSQRVREHMKHIISSTYKNVYDATPFREEKKSTPRYFFRGPLSFAVGEDQYGLYMDTIRRSSSSSSPDTVDTSYESTSQNSITPPNIDVGGRLFTVPEVGSAEDDYPPTPLPRSRTGSVSSSEEFDYRTPPSTPPPPPSSSSPTSPSFSDKKLTLDSPRSSSPSCRRQLSFDSRDMSNLWEKPSRGRFDGVELESEKKKKKPPKKRERIARIFKPNAKSNKKKTEGELREELKVYEGQLQQFLSERNTRYNHLRKREREILEEVKKEIEILTASQRYETREKYRAYMKVKLYLIQSEQRLEKKFKEDIDTRIHYTQQALLDTEGPLPTHVNDDFFKDTEELLYCSPDLARMKKRLRLISNHARELNEDYVKTRKRSRPKTHRERGSELLKLLKEMDIDHAEYTNFLDSLEQSTQDKFNNLIGDCRTTEGRWIQTFLNELYSYGVSKIPPGEIVGYIQAYVNFLCKQHNFGDREERKQKLHRLVERHLFNLIAVELIDVEATELREKDQHFLDQTHYLATLSPLKLGIEPKFLPAYVEKDDNGKELDPFVEAIDTLGYLNFCLVPVDMLTCIKITAKQIHKIAKKNCETHGKSFSFGADEFFPIFVYVVVRSGVTSIHSLLSFLNKFGNMSSRSTEISYFVTCLEGAVVYIDQITQDDMETFSSATKDKNEDRDKN